MQGSSTLPPAESPPRDRFDAILLFVVVYAALIYLTFLGSGRTLTRHEVLITHPAMRILDEGNWIVPRFGSEPWVDKPPLVTWITAVLFWASGGFNEYAARLPAALSAVALCALVAVLTRRFVNAKAALFAGLAQATCVYMYMQGRLGEIDMMFALLLAMAHAVLLWRWGTGATDLPLASAAGFHAIAGLAVLAKGPLAVALLGGTVLCFCWFRRSWRPLRAVLLTPGVACFVAVAGWWYVAAYAQLGATAAQRWDYNYIARAMGLHHLGAQSPLLYFWTIPWLVLPWTIVLVLGAKQLVRDARRPDAYVDRFLWAWFFGGLAVLTAVLFKHKHYAIPILPPLSILTGRLIAEHLPRTGVHGKRVLVGFFAGALVVFLVVGGVVMPRHDHRRPSVEFLREWTGVIPPADRLIVTGLAQAAAYPYIEHRCEYIDDPYELQAAVKAAGDGVLWMLTLRGHLDKAAEFGLYLEEIASEPVRPKYPPEATLVLGRMRLGAPATTRAASQ